MSPWASLSIPAPTEAARPGRQRCILDEVIDRTTSPAPSTAKPPRSRPQPPPNPSPTSPSPSTASPGPSAARIALARKLSGPDRAPPAPKHRWTENDDRCPNGHARRPSPTETDALYAEPCERPEEPDFDADEDLDDDLDDDFDDQSLADLIASLRHDTGLANLTDAQLRQHRTAQSTQASAPGETCALCARGAGPTATQPPTTQPSTGDPRPKSPPRPGTGPPEP